jgi:uncharacterized protein YxjI
MLCPKCGFNSADPQNCPKCGINFEGYKNFKEHQKNISMTVSPAQLPAQVFDGAGLNFLREATRLFVKQQEDALRIVTGWQTLNHYVIMDGDGQTYALLAERDQGFLYMLLRHFFRNRRSLIIDIFDQSGAVMAQLKRPFFWFFSDMYVYDASGSRLFGVVKRRFSFWLPQYSLCPSQGFPFGSLKCPFIGGATIGGAFMGNRNYDVYDNSGQKTGASIMRVWNGLMRIFTDEDTYCVQLTEKFTLEQKLLILAAAVSIDFDSYEGNSNLIDEGAGILGSSGLIGRMIGGNQNKNDFGG